MDADNSPIYEQSAQKNSKRRWFRYIVVFLTAILGIMIIVGLPSVQTVIWDGSFKLELRPVTKTTLQVQNFSYATVNKREIAEFIVQNPKADVEAGFHLAEKHNNEFIANIECSGREILGIETKYYEPRFLVVCVKCDNDSEVRKVIEIPVGRGKRQVTIPLP